MIISGYFLDADDAGLRGFIIKIQHFTIKLIRVIRV